MNTHLRRLTLVAFLLAFVAAPSAAQSDPDAILDRGFQSSVLAVGEATAAAYPTAWRNAHNGQEPSGTEFVRRWALALRAQGILACVNGKRGSDTLSQDVLAFPVTRGWARDTSDRYAKRIMVVDVIGGAGAAGASLVFGPDTSGADGKCIDPYVVSGEGAPPAPGPGPGTPAPPVVTPPAPSVDLGPVLAELRALRSEVAELRARPDVTADMALVRQYLDDMVGNGPGDSADEPNHITDIKQREDKTRALIEQLSAWLHSRRALGF